MFGKLCAWRKAAKKWRRLALDSQRALALVVEGDKAELLKAGPDARGFSLQYRTQLAGILAEGLGQMLDDVSLDEGPNYLEMSFYRARDKTTLRVIAVRPNGESPHDLRKKAEARVAELEEFVRDCSRNWDCDADAHRYDTLCRACEAARLLA